MSDWGRTAGELYVEYLNQRGGRLCLDLANTMDPRLGEHPRENLITYSDLVAWERRAGLVTEKGERDLLERAQQQPEEALAALERARGLREAIYRVFSATAAGKLPAAADVAALRAAYTEGVSRARLIKRDGEFAWDWAEDRSLDRFIGPVAYDAVDLLTSPVLPRVKECPGAGDCGWLFLDTSKNCSRRWCSMETCGSRAKMRRHYAKKRAERTTEPE